MSKKGFVKKISKTYKTKKEKAFSGSGVEGTKHEDRKKGDIK
jgi:hypothetical protein